MKKALYILLPFIMVLFASCEADFLADNPAAGAQADGVTFIISTPVAENEWMSRAADGDSIADETLSSIRYLLADADGRVLTHVFGRFSESLDRLTLEGLAPGDYSIVFLASSTPSPVAEIAAPARLDEAWLSNTLASLPIDGSYFFKKVDFNVSVAPAPIQQRIVLDRALAKVKVNIPGLSSALEEMISSVKLTLDDAECVYTSLNADGSYSGLTTIAGVELRDEAFNLSMSTLPSAAAVSGTVKVTSATLKGDTISSAYRFENVRFEAGRLTEITLKLRHPDMEAGFILIRPIDYFAHNADLMLMEDEPMGVLHDSRHRRFPVTHPLVISTWENQLRIRNFVPGVIEDVDIYANFPSLGIDSVHIARVPRVEAYLDMLVELPFLTKSCHFYDVRGRRVTIPQMSSLPSNVTFSYKTPNAYLARLDALKFSNWSAWCPSYETYWARYAVTPTCYLIRHAFTINQNMAIMFDSEEFYDELAAHEGEYVNNGVYLTNENIIQRIYNTAGFGWGSCNPKSGAEGWGGGSTMIFMHYYFDGGMYPGTNVNSPTTWARECLFHEHGHCLGFSHSGNMTYGGKWVGVTSRSYVKCFVNGKMPYGVPDHVRAVPYKRADAPKWAKPRFVVPVEPTDPDETDIPETPNEEGGTTAPQAPRQAPIA